MAFVNSGKPKSKYSVSLQRQDQQGDFHFRGFRISTYENSCNWLLFFLKYIANVCLNLKYSPPALSSPAVVRGLETQATALVTMD